MLVETDARRPASRRDAHEASRHELDVAHPSPTHDVARVAVAREAACVLAASSGTRSCAGTSAARRRRSFCGSDHPAGRPDDGGIAQRPASSFANRLLRQRDVVVEEDDHVAGRLVDARCCAAWSGSVPCGCSGQAALPSWKSSAVWRAEASLAASITKDLVRARVRVAEALQSPSQRLRAAHRRDHDRETHLSDPAVGARAA